MSAILGVDVGQKELVTHLVRPAESDERASFANTPAGFKKLSRWLQKRKVKDLAVCMEATGRYYEALAQYLYEQGYRVSVVNPAQIKAYSASQLKRNKTDRLDAQGIADFCRTQQPPAWTPPPASWRQLQTLVRHLEALQGDLQRQRNRLHALHHALQVAPTVLTHLEAQIALLEQQIVEVKQAMSDHLDQHPDLKQDKALLTSIPGIGDLTAGKLLVELGAGRRFDDVRQLVAFAGLNPKQHQSGKATRGYTPISKQGRATLRATLYMPALVAKNRIPALRPLVERWRSNGLCEMEIVVAMMRKLLHLVYGVLKSRQAFDPARLSSISIS